MRLCAGGRKNNLLALGNFTTKGNETAYAPSGVTFKLCRERGAIIWNSAHSLVLAPPPLQSTCEHSCQNMAKQSVINKPHCNVRLFRNVDVNQPSWRRLNQAFNEWSATSQRCMYKVAIVLVIGRMSLPLIHLLSSFVRCRRRVELTIHSHLFAVQATCRLVSAWIFDSDRGATCRHNSSD